jgi:hypothetical protein
MGKIEWDLGGLDSLEGDGQRETEGREREERRDITIANHFVTQKKKKKKRIYRTRMDVGGFLRWRLQCTMWFR